jgi:hypothetical protein
MMTFKAVYKSISTHTSKTAGRRTDLVVGGKSEERALAKCPDTIEICSTTYKFYKLILIYG